MNKKNIREFAFYVLAGLVMGLCAYITLKVLDKAIPPENQQVAMVLLGIVIGWGTSIVNYFFGSSKGSSDKSEAMNANPPPTPPTGG